MNRCLRSDYLMDWDNDAETGVAGWDENGGVFSVSLDPPPQSYSKRAKHLNDLREVIARIRKLNDGVDLPAQEVVNLAVGFINALPEGALNCRLAISDDGEVNFFFEGAKSLFHINIIDSRGLNYYGRIEGAEYFGDDVEVANFPFLKLLSVNALQAR